MHPHVERSKRSGNIIAIPILSGLHANISVYDLRKGQDFAAAHESVHGPPLPIPNVRFHGRAGVLRTSLNRRNWPLAEITASARATHG
jgi:hypothetical protein